MPTTAATAERRPGPPAATEQVRSASHVRVAATLVTLTAISAYLLASLFMTGPMNPLRVRYGGVVERALNPYFQQNWQLFAPDPVNVERGLMARARCTDGSESSFVDLTTPYVADVQTDRFFPSREGRTLSNPIHIVFSPDPLAQLVREAQEKRRGGSGAVDERATDTADGSGSSDRRADEMGTDATDEPVMALTDAEKAARAEGERLLAIASARLLEDRCDTSDVDKVQLRHVVHTFPRWSDRENRGEVGEITTINSEWLTGS